MPAQPTTYATAAEIPAIAVATQAVLVDASLAVLREHGYTVRRGEYGDLYTTEVAVAGGRHLVLLPMAETMWGDLDDPDVDVWHLMAVDAKGQYLEWASDVDWPWHCPSVLWADSIGLDPACAVFLVLAALADEDLRAHFDLHA